MAIVVNVAGGGGGGGGGGAPVGNSYLAYDSFFLRSDALSVTADSEDFGQAIENGLSWPTYGGGWQTTTIGEHLVTVGFAATQQGQGYAIHKHNLADLGITVELQNSPDAVVWTTITDSDQTPTNNKTLFFVAAAQESATFWRLRFTGHTFGTLRIAQMFIGPVLQAHQPPGTGWSPPNLALNNDFIQSRADGGDFLGRSLIRRGSKTNFTMSPVPESFVRNSWLPFMEAAELHPFYYSWNAEGFPGEVAYCYVEGRIDIPRYMTHLHFNVPLKFIALQL